MTFGLVLFICVFLAILGLVVVSELSSRNKPTDSMDADLSKE